MFFAFSNRGVIGPGSMILGVREVLSSLERNLLGQTLAQGRLLTGVPCAALSTTVGGGHHG
jgi:hypothetical protein